MKKISIIVPVCNEDENLNNFYDSLHTELKNNKINYEIIFIDDGSIDNSLEIIRKIASKDRKVYYYSLSRNFGKEAAMYCGLSASKGDYVVIMDADLQHPPKVLIEMYKIITNKNVNSVVAVRKRRVHFLSKIFYKVITKLSKIKFVDGETDFRIMTRSMVGNILKLKESNRFSKGLFNWLGFSKEYYEYQDIKRTKGKSKWGFPKLLIYAINGLISFSNTISYLPFILAIILFLAFIILLILLIIKYSSIKLIISILLLLFSILFFVLALITIYLVNIISEVKQRPLYIIQETNKKN